MKPWLWALILLAGCQGEPFSVSGPFTAGTLRVHAAQEQPVPGLQKLTAPEGAPLYVDATPALTEADVSRISVGRAHDGGAALFLNFRMRVQNA